MKIILGRVIREFYFSEGNNRRNKRFSCSQLFGVFVIEGDSSKCLVHSVLRATVYYI